MQQVSKRNLKASALLALALALVAAQVAVGQRNEDSGESDDFDDPGFDDNGYHQPQRDTDSSNHQPNQYAPESGAGADADEDDEPDETHVTPQLAPERRQRQQAPYTGQAQHFDEPRQFYGEPVVLDAALDRRGPHPRFRRSTSEGDIEDRRGGQRSLVRRRRHSKGYLGPVYTYVKTDKHANFKWGVKHKVGKHLG